MDTVIINNDIVDVSKFKKWHPGGSHILTSNRCNDVTDLFYSFHSNVNYSHLVVGRNEESGIPKYVFEFRQLNTLFKKEKWYEPSKLEFAKHIVICGTIFLASFCFLWLEYSILSGIAMGFFWQQSAGLGHDLGHSSVVTSRKGNMMIGSVMSTVTGISSVWWRHSHFQHHTHTNVKEEDPDIIHMPIFSISEKLLVPFYHNFLHEFVIVDKFAVLLIRIQHMTIFPILLFARFNLYAQSLIHIVNLYDSYVQVEKIGFCLFFCWQMAILYSFGFVKFMIFFLFSHLVSGILHFQIVISHWMSEVKSTEQQQIDHFLHTLETTVDVNCSKHLDWFHIGLQFQIAHHMFPKLPRSRLREATNLIKAICFKHNLPYKSASFFELNVQLYDVMKNVACNHTCM